MHSDTNIEGESCRQCDRYERDLEKADRTIQLDRAALANRDARIAELQAELRKRPLGWSHICATPHEVRGCAFCERDEARSKLDSLTRTHELTLSALENRERRVDELKSGLDELLKTPAIPHEIAAVQARLEQALKDKKTNGDLAHEACEYGTKTIAELQSRLDAALEQREEALAAGAELKVELSRATGLLEAMQSRAEAAEADWQEAERRAKEAESRLDSARKAVRDRLIASGHGSSIAERTLDEWFGVVERQNTK